MLLSAVLLGSALLGFGQAGVSTGSIQGTVTDASGAVLPGAVVEIKNEATGQVVTFKANDAGVYTSGALLPGEYRVRISNGGFKSSEQALTVQVGVTTSGNAKLQVGQAAEVVNVQAGSIQVNTQQVAVQDVLTARQIEQLPINGRNFLDLAQLEPGVQIQDGGNFDPTKSGFSSISFGGRFGRTARIEVDGIDISDETVGTTTQNIPQSAIQEFQIGQSSLDLATELTSSGAVNVVTRAGTNEYHGEAFYLFRTDSTAASIGEGKDIPYQRNQFGGRFGGALIKNKLFFFTSAERTKQDLFAPVVLSAPFSGLSGGFNSPFREAEALGRLDWQIKPGNYHLFYRFSYDETKNVATFVPNSFNPYANRNNTPVHGVGFDFTTGPLTHSIRFSYLKMRNGIVDAVSGSNIFNPAPEVLVTLGSSPVCNLPGDLFCSGPSFLQPQATLQSDKQVKYDGAYALHSHIIRYGVAVNRIVGNLFTKQLGFAPAVNSVVTPAGAPGSTIDFANTGPFPGGASNPLNYPAQLVIMSNGQGSLNERPSFGRTGGGLFSTRLLWYVGDSWKARPNLTVNYGVRYLRDTGRTNSDLPAIPVLNQLLPGLGNRVRQPNMNFAPSLGLSWDPFKSGKTVVRAGAGLYYENAVFNNSTLDRPGRLAKGLFFGVGVACAGGTPIPVSFPDGTTVTPTFCNQPIGTAASQVPAFLQVFQQATVAAGAQSNPNFVGDALTASVNSTGANLFAPNYQTPRSVQFNVGIQRQLASNTVLSVDYLRNVATHTLLGIDVNHVGDAGTLNVGNAAAAISSTLATCQASSIDQAIAACPGLHPGGATISDFASLGLDSGTTLCGGFPCPTAAFAGINSQFGVVQMMFPIGRSVYNGLQVSLKQNVDRPFRGLKALNLQVSYALSRLDSTSRDQDFTNGVSATDFRNPLRFIGPNGLDRTNQFSFGAYAELPASFRVGLIGHFQTALPQTLTIPSTGAPGDIFESDLTGDGTVGDVLSGTNIGSFGRSVKLGDLNQKISNFNSTVAHTLTPAGQALVNAGLFTQAQLVALGAVVQPLSPAPSGQVGLDPFKTMDLRLSYVYRKERFEVEPSIGAYNLFNFANFDGPSQPLSGVLSGQALSLNGTTTQTRTNRIGLGSGVFALGAPRIFEWGLRVSF
jgi:hypothetical protein